MKWINVLSALALTAVSAGLISCDDGPPLPPADIIVCKGFLMDAVEVRLGCPVGAEAPGGGCSFRISSSDTNTLKILPTTKTAFSRPPNVDSSLHDTIGERPGMVTLFATNIISGTPFSGDVIRLATVLVTNQSCLQL
jgi:hypothetical protein